MTDREKIINIMQSVRYCKPDSGCGGCKYDAELDNYSYVSCRTLRIADALIATGIGDVKEAEYRAKIAEMVLLFLCNKTMSDVSVMIFPSTKTQLRNNQELYDYCIKQAEKELAKVNE